MFALALFSWTSSFNGCPFVSLRRNETPAPIRLHPAKINNGKDGLATDFERHICYLICIHFAQYFQYLLEPRYANWGARSPTHDAATPTIPYPIFLTGVGNDSPVKSRMEDRLPAEQNFASRSKLCVMFEISITKSSLKMVKIAREIKNRADPDMNRATKLRRFNLK